MILAIISAPTPLNSKPLNIKKNRASPGTLKKGKLFALNPGTLNPEQAQVHMEEFRIKSLPGEVLQREAGKGHTCRMY